MPGPDAQVLALSIGMSVAVATALLAAVLTKGETKAIRLFVILNIAIAILLATQLLELTRLSQTHILSARPPSAGWLVASASSLAIGIVPPLWFLFAALQSGRTELARGWTGLWLRTHGAATFVAGSTNHWHGWASRVPEAGGNAIAGPLAYPLAASGIALCAWGILLLYRYLARRDDDEGDILAPVFAMAIALPLAGNAAFNLSALLGAPWPFDPSSSLFPIAAVVLLWTAFRSGLTDIVPIAAAQAFKTMADAAIVTDDRLRVITANPIAQASFPEVKPGALLADVMPEVAVHARSCAAEKDAYVPFEFRKTGEIYWGRVHSIKPKGSRALGCIVLLSDITDLRYTQQQLDCLLKGRLEDAVSHAAAQQD